MSIPEITPDCLELLNGVLAEFEGVFSQCSPIPSDPLFEASQATKATQDVDLLIELGLVKELTEDHKEQIEKQNAATGRKWRVYCVSPLGRALFQATCSPSIN
jgi:hypothetical protein